MSKKKIEQIPSQIVTKETNKLQLRKTLLNTKFNWLIKYITKEETSDNDDSNYLMTSIKMRPQMRNHLKRNILNENRYILNRSHENGKVALKYESKNTLQQKYSKIRTRLYTENVQYGSKSKRGRNTSLLLNSTNPKQTFNFIQNDVRRLGYHLKTDLQLRKKVNINVVKTEVDHFRLTPWNLDEQDKQNTLQGL